jgi:hypothetical protein
VQDLGNVDVLVTQQQYECIPSGSKQARKPEQQWRSVMSEMALSQDIMKRIQQWEKRKEMRMYTKVFS